MNNNKIQEYIYIYIFHEFNSSLKISYIILRLSSSCFNNSFESLTMIFESLL